MEDEVKALLDLVNKLQPSVADPVHSSQFKKVSFCMIRLWLLISCRFWLVGAD